MFGTIPNLIKLDFKIFPMVTNSKSNKIRVRDFSIDGVNITHAEAIWILATFRTSIIVNN